MPGVVFRHRHGSPDWSKIASSPAIDEVVANSDVASLQDLVDTITFSHIKQEDFARCDYSLMVKTFGYAQLIIEYLLNVQTSLSVALKRTKEDLEEEKMLVEEKTRDEKLQEQRARALHRQVRQKQGTLQAAARMLAEFGVDTTALRRMSEDTWGDTGATQAEYVWVPAYLDPFDGKAFQSAEHLKKHMYRKHHAQIRAELGMFGLDGGAPPPPPQALEGRAYNPEASTAIGMKASSERIRRVMTQAEKHFALMDVDNSGTITLQEFITGINNSVELQRLCGVADVRGDDQASMLAEFKTCFQAADVDGDGSISLSELKSFMKSIEFFSMGFTAGRTRGFDMAMADLDAEDLPEKEDEIVQVTDSTYQLYQHLNKTQNGTVDCAEILSALMTQPAIAGSLGFADDVPTKDALGFFQQRFSADQGPATPGAEQLFVTGTIPVEQMDAFLQTIRVSVAFSAQATPGAAIVADAPAEPGKSPRLLEASPGPDEEGESKAEDGEAEAAADPGKFAAAEQLAEHMDFWFEVTIVGARNLRAADANGKSDPVVRCHLANPEAKGKAKGKVIHETKNNPKKTLCPIWKDETFSIAMHDLKNKELIIKMWDKDTSFLGSKEVDFLGRVTLGKRDMTSMTGNGPVLLPLLSGVGPGEDIRVSGHLEISVRAFAAVDVSISGARGIKAGDSGGTSDPFVQMLCHGCQILNKPKERKAISAHEYKTNVIKRTLDPDWNEAKTLKVPLDRYFGGVKFRLFDDDSSIMFRSQDSLGEVKLSAEAFLMGTPTTAKEREAMEVTAKKSRRRSYEDEDDMRFLTREFKLEPIQEAGTLQASDEDPVTGQLMLKIVSPVGVAQLYQRCRERQLAANSKMPLMNQMEVEIAVMSASNLREKFQPFAEVSINGKVQGRTKAHATTKDPTWRRSHHNRVVVEVPFPENWATCTPSTQVTVAVFDHNTLTSNEYLGEVRLSWGELVHPSLKEYSLLEPVANSEYDKKKKKRGWGRSREKAVQGSLWLRVRPLQALELYIIGASGLVPLDNDRASDPFVVVSTHTSTSAANVESLPPGAPPAGDSGGGASLSANTTADEGQTATTEAAASSQEDTMAPPSDDVQVSAAAKGGTVRTKTKQNTLSPAWFHKVLLTRARNPGDSSAKLVKGEADRRAGLLETQHGIPKWNGKHAHVIDGAIPLDNPESFVLKLAVFDEDDIGSQFMGQVVLTGKDLTAPKGGVISLPLMDDPSRKKSTPVTGWIQLMFRVGPPLQMRAGQTPLPQRLPAVDVKLNVLGASDLPAADTACMSSTATSSDPYVRVYGDGVWSPNSTADKPLVQIGALIGKTKTIPRSLNPVWNQSFFFTAPVTLDLQGQGESDDPPADPAPDGEAEVANAVVVRAPQVRFEVYDRDQFGEDDLLGTAKLSTKQLLLPQHNPLPEAGIDLEEDAEKAEKRRKRNKRMLFSCMQQPEVAVSGSLRLSIELQARVEVRILDAFGLKAANLDGTSDPFAELSLVINGKKEGKTQKTAVKKSTLSPEFSETFFFSVPMNDPTAMLVIDVKDAPMMLGTTFLGQIRLQRNQLLGLDSQGRAQALAPPAAPALMQLHDRPRGDKWPNGKKASKNITGTLEVHVRASQVPSAATTAGDEGELFSDSEAGDQGNESREELTEDEGEEEEEEEEAAAAAVSKPPRKLRPSGRSAPRASPPLPAVEADEETGAVEESKSSEAPGSGASTPREGDGGDPMAAEPASPVPQAANQSSGEIDIDSTLDTTTQGPSGER